MSGIPRPERKDGCLESPAHVRKELELKSLLAHCYTLECTCCMLTATSADLDSIVEFGLKNGLITIQPEAA